MSLIIKSLRSFAIPTKLSALLACCLILLFSPILSVAQEDIPEDSFSQVVEKLKVKSFKDKELAILELQGIKDPRTIKVLRAMLEGGLYYRKDDGQVVVASRSDDEYQITSIISGKMLGLVSKRSLRKIIANNKIRRLLRTAIAELSLSHKDAKVRLSAVKEIIAKVDLDIANKLRELAKTENDKEVLEVIHIGLALFDVNSEDNAIRFEAVTVLGKSLLPAARNSLVALLEQTPEGEYEEADVKIRNAASTALQGIDDKIEFYGFLETVFFGVSLGSVLLLIAIGLAITFGVMGVINMAHGELMMLGAYTTYVVQLMMPNHIDLSLFVAIPAAFIVAGLFGIAIERGVIRFLYGRPLETLLATFGLSLILQQMVRSIFSPLNRSVVTPSWMSGSWEINSIFSLTYNRLYIVIFSLIVFFSLLMILKKTSLGLKIRAVSQNRSMAKAMGVRTEWVDALTFGLGSGVAGVAGVALSQLTNVGPNLGQTYIIDSFLVVVFGGVGNLWGTLVGSLSLGIMNKFLEPWVGAVLAKIFVLVFIILFIQKRPRGLFPQKGRAADN